MPNSKMVTLDCAAHISLKYVLKIGICMKLAEFCFLMGLYHFNQISWCLI